MCVTWENVGADLSLYVNGVLIGHQRSVHPGLYFNKTGTLVIGQFKKTPDAQIVLAKSFLGEISDVNIWSSVLSLLDIKWQSEACYLQYGDSFAWPTFSNGLLQFDNEVNSVASEGCRGKVILFQIHSSPSLSLSPQLSSSLSSQ